MDPKIFRVVDANFNRSKEGLRVIEDIFRFIWEDDKLREKTREIRHAMDSIAKSKILKEAVLARNSEKDLGKKTDVLEVKREDSTDILFINFQRVKESLRVLEEFFKIICSSQVRRIKKLRYEVYDLELCARVKKISLQS